MASDLKHIPGRVVVKVFMEIKNSHTFANGTTIYLGRDFDNLDRKYTAVSQGEVVSGENIPSKALILFHPNASTDTYRIFNYKPLSGEDIASDIRYFSIPEDQCYLWKDENDIWTPLKGYETGLRIFKPYKGLIHNIEPTLIKDHLYVTSGVLKYKVVVTLKSCDYELIFNDTNGQEKRIIRFRHSDENENYEREEVVAIHDGYTKKIKQGELLVGLTASQAECLVNHPV